MPLELDKINALEDQIVRVKELALRDIITLEEARAAIAKLKAELKALFGFSG